MLKSKFLFFITGSIAAFKAAQVVSRLVQDGHEVQCLATASALRFIGAATFEGLTGKKVLSDLWESGRAMDHIHLSRWADAGVVCPASANTIAQMALGLTSDVVSATLLAWPQGKPLFVFPAMNLAMLSAQATQRHLQTLRERGVQVALTGSGALACGETGEGRLLEPDEILAMITQGSPLKQKILITGGATRESIDGIRFISNVSTGRTAAELCDRLSTLGWNVTYLHGQQARQPGSSVYKLNFSDFNSLNQQLRDELSRESYHAVIHCAAVSDFAVATVNGAAPGSSEKLKSGGELALMLKPTVKILPNLKEYSRDKNIRVVGFKLTLNATEEEQTRAASAILGGGVDAVVGNDWAQVSGGVDAVAGTLRSQVGGDRSRHPGFVLANGMRREFDTVEQLALILNHFFTKDAL